MDTILVAGVAAVAVLSLFALLAVRKGWLYRSPRYLEWRKAKSRRDRGKVKAGGPLDGGGADPTASL